MASLLRLKFVAESFINEGADANAKVDTMATLCRQRHLKAMIE